MAPGLRRGGVLLGCLGGLLLAGLGPGISAAQAHPLNNFSINQYHGLELRPDVVLDHAVIDIAEVPTLQQKSGVDADRDGTASAAELSQRAEQECTVLAGAVRGTVGGQPLSWSLRGSSMAYLPGEKGLQVTRIECELAAPANLAVVSNLDFATSYQDNHVGWREITATGRGVAMTAASVADRSVSDALRVYPEDLLASPLDQREARLTTRPGQRSFARAARRGWTAPAPWPASLAPVNRTFDGLLDRDLTLGVGWLPSRSRCCWAPPTRRCPATARP